MKVDSSLTITYHNLILLGKNRRQLGDYDVHIIVGVLLSCFREMPLPLFHDMKDDFTDIGNTNSAFIILIIFYRY